MLMGWLGEGTGRMRACVWIIGKISSCMNKILWDIKAFRKVQRPDQPLLEKAATVRGGRQQMSSLNSRFRPFQTLPLDQFLGQAEGGVGHEARERGTGSGPLSVCVCVCDGAVSVCSLFVE